MLGMMFLLVGGFLLLVRMSYRSAQRKAEEGRPFVPQGKLRWGD